MECFFRDLSKKAHGRKSKIEIMNSDIGNQILDDGLPLTGFTVTDRNGKISLEISVGKDAGHHQTHSILSPQMVAFAGKGLDGSGVVEIVENEGTMTLVHIEDPEPIGVLGAGSNRATAAVGLPSKPKSPVAKK